MIQALSITGDVFWILCLALMSSLSWNAWKRIAPDTQVPVAWKGEAPSARAHRLPALWLVPVLAFALGAWLKFESRAPGIGIDEALITLGVRLTLAPLVAVLHMSQVRRALATLEAEGNLRP
ncbi:MAG: hypothetical protein HY859_01350 [Caulobacterales bacterium]|nr:hypothetical protein [Caulobacterales bacterium]